MNEKPIPIILNLRLSPEAAIALPLDAGTFGLTNEEMASALLDYELTSKCLGDDDRGILLLDQVRLLYPERWPKLTEAYDHFRQAIEATEASERAKYEKYLAGQISLTLPPAMVQFMRETGKLFPELWDIFAGECVEAVVDNLPHYLDNAFSFQSPQDRMEAFRLVKAALIKYRASGSHHRASRGVSPLGSQSGPDGTARHDPTQPE